MSRQALRTSVTARLISDLNYCSFLTSLYFIPRDRRPHHLIRVPTVWFSIHHTSRCTQSTTRFKIELKTLNSAGCEGCRLSGRTDHDSLEWCMRKRTNPCQKHPLVIKGRRTGLFLIISLLLLRPAKFQAELKKYLSLLLIGLCIRPAQLKQSVSYKKISKST